MQQNPLQNYRLVGISGKLGSGKTSLAVYMQTLDPHLRRHSFADKLREVLQVMTGLAPAQTRSTEQKNAQPEGWGKSVGILLQDMGEAMRAAVHVDAWVLAMGAQWREASTSETWVIDDVRHLNEAEWIKSQGGILIRLEGDPGDVRAHSTRDLVHISETALDAYQGFDVVVDTDQFRGHWPQLYREVVRQLKDKGQ